MDATLNTVPKRVQHWGNTHPEEPAFIFWGPTGRFVLSRGELLDLSTRFATRLINRGVRPGDVIGVLLSNCPERLVVDFGIQFAGAIPLNVQTLYTTGEGFIAILNKGRCKMIIVDPDLQGEGWEYCRSRLKLKITQPHEVVSSQEVPSLVGVEYCNTLKPDMRFMKSLISEQQSTVLTAKPSDIGYIFSTSGTTGLPKTISHTYRSLLSMSRAVTNYVDRVCLTGHLGWNGCYTFSYVNLGCCNVLLDLSNGTVADGFGNIESLLKMMKCEDVKVAFIPASQLVEIYNRRGIWESSRFMLKNIVSGGQPPKSHEFKTVGTITEKLSYVYGCSELGAITMATITESNQNDSDDWIAGFPVAGAQVKIDNESFDGTKLSHTREITHSQRIGEILVRSDYHCMDNDASISSRFTADGWFKTGDAGYLREDGCLFVIGRISQAIIQDGKMVFPVFLEKTLVQCPGVKDVAVVPVQVPNQNGKQELCACVKVEEGTNLRVEDVNKLIESLKNKKKQFGDFSSPMYVFIFESFPYTRAMKLDRLLLAELANLRIDI